MTEKRDLKWALEYAVALLKRESVESEWPHQREDCRQATNMDKFRQWLNSHGRH